VGPLATAALRRRYCRGESCTGIAEPEDILSFIVEPEDIWSFIDAEGIPHDPKFFTSFFGWND